MTEQNSTTTPVRQIVVAGTAGRSSIATMIAALLHARGASVLLATGAWLHAPSEAITLDGAPLEPEQLRALGFAGFPHDADQTARLLVQVVEQARPDWLVVSGFPPQSPSAAVAVLAPILPAGGVSAAEAAQTLLAQLPPTHELVCAPQRESVLDVIRPYATLRGLSLSEVALSCRLAKERSDLDGQQFRIKTKANEYRLRLSPLGAFQLENAATAVLAVEHALHADSSELSPGDARKALEAIRLPGRAEVIKRRPLIIVDAASSAASLRRLIEAIQPLVRPGRLQVVLDASAWNEIAEAVRLFAPLEPEIIAVGGATTAWAESCALASLQFRSAQSIESAVQSLTDAPGDPLVVAGSRSAAANARAHVLALLPADLRLN
jgi:dihydrofolate synthase / folylpolyglutamate synthase